VTIPPQIGQPVLNQGLNAAAVTASDTTIVGPTRFLYVGTSSSAQDVVEMWGDNAGTSITLKNVIAGTFLPLNVKRVMAATTASDIVAIY